VHAALGRPLACDAVSNFAGTGRFVIVDGYDIAGGGIVREALPDAQAQARDTVLRRNLQSSASGVEPERRAERLSQRPALLVITGDRTTDRMPIARELEARLFAEGRFVYSLSIGNLLCGVDADLERSDATRSKHDRRVGEVASILLDAASSSLLLPSP
jgi:bifunctional enzyme CysN/CysC